MGWSSGFGGGGEGGWGRGGDALSRELRPAGSHWLGGGATRQPVCVASRRWPDPGVSQQSAAGIGGGAASLRRGQHGGRRDLEGERGGGRRRGLRAGAARRGSARSLCRPPPPQPPRLCEDYWWEWKHCRGLRHAFHHYYAHGELPACGRWRDDYEACRAWERGRAAAAQVPPGPLRALQAGAGGGERPQPPAGERCRRSPRRVGLGKQASARGEGGRWS